MLCINLILVARGYIYKMSQSVIIMPTSEFKEQSIGEMYGKYFICRRKKCMKVVREMARGMSREFQPVGHMHPHFHPTPHKAESWLHF